MRPKPWQAFGMMALTASGLAVAAWSPRPCLGDEPSRLGRLFRLGNGPATYPAPPPPTRPATPAAAPSPVTLPATPEPGATNGPRLIPQPRISRPVTDADPILTRVAIGRSDDGKTFGMFLQVFADGTVLDSDGIHHVGPDALRPLIGAIQSADASRIRGHCGGPATDFVEQVHIVVYDRTLGRLRANAFSHSGNTQDCDPSVRQLQAAIDAFQARLGSPPAAASAPTPPPTSGAPGSPPITLSPAE